MASEVRSYAIQVHEGDVLDVSAPRGRFTLRPGENPVVLLSAGVGATPVMPMLHGLAAERSEREVGGFMERAISRITRLRKNQVHY